jgi:cytochrome c
MFPYARACGTLIAALFAVVHAHAAAAVDGATIAQRGGAEGVPACAACHGAHGEGNAAGGFPRLAGIGRDYLARQLDAFADGSRQSPVMAPIAKALPPADRTAVASYFASLPAPQIGSSPPARVASDGEILAVRGRWSDGLPACERCHGPKGAGVGLDFPPLAGQPATYIAAQLRAWKTGARGQGPLGLMRAVADKLADADVDAVSAYLGSGAPAAPASADATRTADESTPRPSALAGHPAPTHFLPPPESAIPNNDFGRLVRLGERIFTDTGNAASQYVGNDLRCSNCHLDAGRLANSAPLWAAYVAYPQYRAKTREVNTYGERLQGCFMYSMNGKAPALDSETLIALEVYSYWLATGAPVNAHLAGAGYPKLAKPEQAPDYARGARVYAEHCALCHGQDGQGQRVGGTQVFPPLWGSRSFNWGAGMHQVNTAAAFVKANMPLGLGGSLTEQQAWDVAYFMDAHERPQDPRFAESVAETRKRFHDTPESLYGLTVDGHLLGSAPAPSRRTLAGTGQRDR